MGRPTTDGDRDGDPDSEAVARTDTRWLPVQTAPRRGPLLSLRTVHRRAAVRLQLLRLWFEGRAAGQHGMATAEYAIATLGAVAFAGLLVVIMRSDEVRGFLLGIIRAALALP
ncbi:DUF4244 domain-containing protein [Sinomonas sp. ASV486]|uniref:DUF4244 domain-containing protein n=1 Tax=Sinomonas TaxID=596707 RepID=UPI0035A5EE8E